MADPYHPEPALQKQLDRQLGLASVFSIAVGAMLGSGIFVLPGMAASMAGPSVGLAYLLAGLMVLPALLSKAEMATAMPISGGTYVYVDRALGPWAGTITGLGTWLSLSAKTAFKLAGLGAYLAIISAMDPMHFALGILTLMLVLNIMGTSKVSGLQVTVVGICLVALALFVMGGSVTMDTTKLAPFFPEGHVGVIECAAFVFVSYAGVTKVCSVAEEIRDPGRNIPWGMIAAQLTMMAIYALVTTVIVGAVSYTELAEDVTPLATAAGVLFGPTGLIILAVVAIIGLISGCNAGVLSATRFPFAMGRDQLMPSFLQRIHSRLGTPIYAILLTGLLLVLLLTGLPVIKLAKLASGFKIFIFCVVNAALIILRETAPEWYQPKFRAPLYPWLQIAGILGGFWLLFQLGWIAMAGVSSVVVIGTVWYWIYPRTRVERTGVLRHIWGEELIEQTASNEARDASRAAVPRVIVPLLRAEEDATLLMRLGASFVERDGLLEVVRLEEVPDQTLLSYFAEEDDRMRLLEAESDQVGEQLHVNVEFRDVITHNARQALAHHAELVNAEWIVMSWPGRSAFQRLIPNPISWWLENPPCDLAVYKPASRASDRTAQGLSCFQRILVLAAPGPYDSLLVHVADRLATKCGGRLTLFMPAPVEESDTVMAAHREYHKQFTRMCEAPAEGLVLRTADSVSAVEELSRDYDLLILGAPPESPLRNLLLGTPDLELMERARCAVLRLKTPRHKVHTRFHHGVQSHRLDEDMEPFLRHAALVPRLRVADKRELFTQVARSLAAVEDTDLELPISEALWARENEQSTALPGGVALNGFVLPGVEAPTIGVFTTASPVSFDGSSWSEVDVLVVILACPADRQTQLWLKDLFAQLFADGWLAEHLRDARNIATMLDILRQAFRRHATAQAPPLPELIPLDNDDPPTEEVPREGPGYQQ